MSRCELTGKGPVVKNLVSHSNIKTKSRAQVNIQSKKLYSQALNESKTFNLATSTLRTIEKKGSFDSFILNQPEEKMSKRALQFKNKIRRKLAGKSSAKQGAQA